MLKALISYARENETTYYADNVYLVALSCTWWDDVATLIVEVSSPPLMGGFSQVKRRTWFSKFPSPSPPPIPHTKLLILRVGRRRLKFFVILRNSQWCTYWYGYCFKKYTSINVNRLSVHVCALARACVPLKFISEILHLKKDLTSLSWTAVFLSDVVSRCDQFTQSKFTHWPQTKVRDDNVRYSTSPPCCRK